MGMMSVSGRISIRLWGGKIFNNQVRVVGGIRRIFYEHLSRLRGREK